MKENSAAIHIQAPVDVAAYLLNEKRGEILKIETRHRVGIIMIPNKYLETPHYKLERIKHDDARLEEVQVSYMMAEEAETDISYSKRQKEEAKPRQEAMVKGITPDQPAPIVDRTPVAPAPVPAAPVVMAPAEEGFFSKVLSFFTKKPAAVPAAVVVTQVVAERPAQKTDRGDRTTRGPRGRSRGGRGGRDREDRDGAAATPRDDGVKGNVGAAVAGDATQTRPPRPPREPREPKEAREPREAREPKEVREPREPREPREAREPREPAEARRERTPRPPREDRKDGAVKADREESLQATVAMAGLPVVALTGIDAIEGVSNVGPAPTSPMANGDQDMVDDGLNAGEGVDGDSAQTEEQTRRRRRRGGRNRNRREREGGEAIEGSANGEESAVAESEAVDSTTLEAAAHVPEVRPSVIPMPFAEPVSGIDESPEPAVSRVSNTPSALSNAMAAPLIPQEVARIHDHVSQPETAARPEAATVVDAAAPAEHHGAVEAETPAAPAETAAQTTAQSTEQTAAPAAGEANPASVASIAVLQPEFRMPAPVEPAPVAAIAPVVAQVVAAPAALAPAAPMPVSTPAVVTPAVAVLAPAPAMTIAPAPMPVEQLQEVLGSAGLTLASTDPEKLRAAQQAAQQASAPPRLGREPKQAPPPPAEPLEQVETR